VLAMEKQKLQMPDSRAQPSLMLYQIAAFPIKEKLFFKVL